VGVGRSERCRWAWAGAGRSAHAGAVLLGLGERITPTREHGAADHGER